MAGLGTRLGAQAADSGAAGPTVLLTRDKFLPLVGSAFEVKAGQDGRAWMTLLSVESMPEPQSPTPRRLETTLLNFQSTDPSLDQGTYEFSSSMAGDFQLFVVPGGNSLYTATICHLAGA